MIYCRICKCEIGFMGWAKHVRMHKKKVERHIGHFPTWQEVLEYFWVVTPKEYSERKHRTLNDFEAYQREIDELNNIIKAKNTAIEAVAKKQKYKFRLKIKVAAFDVSEEYLQTFLDAVKSISGVVQAEWGRN